MRQLWLWLRVVGYWPADNALDEALQGDETVRIHSKQSKELPDVFSNMRLKLEHLPSQWARATEKRAPTVLLNVLHEPVKPKLLQTCSAQQRECLAATERWRAVAVPRAQQIEPAAVDSHP